MLSEKVNPQRLHLDNSIHITPLKWQNYRNGEQIIGGQRKIEYGKMGRFMKEEHEGSFDDGNVLYPQGQYLYCDIDTVL